jgi:SNF2 family DNA or RNA helicase
MDRIHRLGQRRGVVVRRFVVRNTIEERIVALHHRKKLLFASTVGMDEDALTKLSVADLKFLFRV